MSALFIFYRRSDQRQKALTAPPSESPARYLLYGLEDMQAQGWDIKHNLDPSVVVRPGHKRMERYLNVLLTYLGARSGDFASPLAFRQFANQADLIVSTGDTQGLPLLTLHMMSVIRRPILYFSVGLPERMNAISPLWQKIYRAWFQNVTGIVAYGFAEAEWLQNWFRECPHAPPVFFIPFGVDTEYFKPIESSKTIDVLSIGADPHRDFSLLVKIAAQRPNVSFRIIASHTMVATWNALPSNLEVLCDVPLEDIRHHMSLSRIMALPLKDNTYSGATTTLLQAMSMAMPTIVTQVGAIQDGYGLHDGDNCMLVPPGDTSAMTKAIDRLLSDHSYATTLGKRARHHVTTFLQWPIYTRRLVEIIGQILPRNPPRRSI
jgi:glycosyltransferase involved in cell wall biosynthesis